MIILIIIDIDKQESKWHNNFQYFGYYTTTELWMTKYIIGEIFSSGGTTLYKNPSDQTVISLPPIVDYLPSNKTELDH